MTIQRLVLTLLTALLLFGAVSAQAQVLGRDGLPILNAPNPDGTVGSSDCFFAHNGVGCDNPQCEATVCAVDSFCCDVAWDGICAGGAVALCSIVDSIPDAAVFNVTKIFADGNDGSVEVTLNCFTGLPLVQSQMVSGVQEVDFVVQSFADGALDCDITEVGVDGYSADYVADASGTGGSVECSYDDVTLSSTHSCTITNTPDPVEVVVNKTWVIDGEGGNVLDDDYEISISCDNGFYDHQYGSGTGDAEFVFDVTPDWDGGTDCDVSESVFDSAVEVTDDCGDLHIDIGVGDECTVTNTVFFEGIPSLNQYGIAIMALLMLGLGFVGFRRFV